LRDVQRHFPAINAVLNSRRDDFSDTVRQNMLTATSFSMQLSMKTSTCSATTGSKRSYS
jgi:hypothetical protein